MTMDDQGLAQARRILKDLDLFRHCKDRDLEVTRLGGLTKLGFRIDQGNQHYVLRVPGQGTEEYINRIHEVRAALGAARVRVSPSVLHADPAPGVMVSRVIDESGR